MNMSRCLKGVFGVEDVAYMSGRLVGEVLSPTQHIYLEGWKDDSGMT